MEVTAGRFDTIVLEVSYSNGAGMSTQTEWWAEGVGVVKIEGETVGTELLSFALP